MYVNLRKCLISTKNFFLLIFVLSSGMYSQYEWSEPVMISEKTMWPDAFFMDNTVTVDKNGIIHAFWSTRIDLFNDDYSQIMHRLSSDGGINWSATVNLTPQFTTERIGNLNVVCDSKNNLHLMFLRGTEWSKVMHMKYDGSSWTVPVSIYDYAISNLRIAICNNDRIYAIWYSDPAYYSYFENNTWTAPKSISDTYMPSIHDVIVTNEDNVYACGSVGGVNNYRPFVCRYDLSLEEWNDFIQIPGFEENSWVSCMTFSKNDTLNVNVGVGPTTQENVNYNLRRKIDELSWSSPQYVNENTDMKRKDFFSDNDDKLHLFESNSDDSSLVYSLYNGDEWIENVVQHEIGNNFQRQKACFVGQDKFYMTYEKVYYSTNERAIFFQKKQIEVGIENQSESIIEDYKLFQNYPNPFNPVTTISYMLTNPAYVKLAVYSLNGQLVQTLVNEKKEEGIHKVYFNASDLSSGIYFYNLTVNGKSIKNMKMLYIR